jgi:hypothetical protein
MPVSDVGNITAVPLAPHLGSRLRALCLALHLHASLPFDSCRSLLSSNISAKPLHLWLVERPVREAQTRASSSILWTDSLAKIACFEAVNGPQFQFIDLHCCSHRLSLWGAFGAHQGITGQSSMPSAHIAIRAERTSGTDLCFCLLRILLPANRTNPLHNGRTPSRLPRADHGSRAQ